MGRTLAVDASNFIYQFLVAVRSSDGTGYSSMLTNDAGEVTSHLQGVFNRTVRIMEAGIRPVYVFDGKPPESKAAEVCVCHSLALYPCAPPIHPVLPLAYSLTP